MCQPPLMHTPPPMAVNGSGKPLQVVGGRLLFGSHPPLTHVPPPVATNGSGVEQVVGVGWGWPVPGGSQPPFTHVPPPIAAKGSAVVQPPGLVPPGGSPYCQPPFRQ